MNIHEALSPPKINLQPVEHISAFRQRQGAEYVRKAAAIIKTAFEVSGDPTNIVCQMYTALLKRPEPTIGNMKLASIAMQSLGRVIRQKHAMEKQALGPAAFLSGARNLVGGVTSAMGPAANLLMGLGATGGALVGGTGWALNRAIGSEDQKSREMEIQRDTYRRLAAEVQNELARRKLKPNPANTAAAVDYLT